MLCQNCGSKDALVHFKHISNGEALEIHFCAECACILGYTELFPGFILEEAEVPRDFSLGSKAYAEGYDPAICEVCGFSFTDIKRSGRPGCPNCYRVFAASLEPMLKKLHGNTVYEGKKPLTQRQKSNEEQLSALKIKLNQAIEAQEFELAATLRDQILSLSGGAGK